MMFLKVSVLLSEQCIERLDQHKMRCVIITNQQQVHNLVSKLRGF